MSEAIYARLFPGKLSRGDQTKLKIIEAAIAHIGREGIDSLTFEVVGRPLGINRAQVKYHFPEKDDLVAKALEYMIASAQTYLIGALEKAKSWKEQVEALLESQFAWARAHPEQGALWLYFHYSATHHPAHRALLTRMEEMGRERLVGILAQSGRWTPEEAESLNHHLWSILDGFLFYQLALKPKDKGLFHREARKAIARALR